MPSDGACSPVWSGGYCGVVAAMSQIVSSYRDFTGSDVCPWESCFEHLWTFWSQIQSQLVQADAQLKPMVKGVPQTTAECHTSLMKIVSDYCRLLRQASPWSSCCWE